MLSVTKRSGKVEPFSIEKVKNSLAFTSDEAHIPLTEGDLHSITNDLLEMLREKTSITSREIYIMVVGILYARRFFDQLKSYVNSPSNYWKLL